MSVLKKLKESEIHMNLLIISHISCSFSILFSLESGTVSLRCKKNKKKKIKVEGKSTLDVTCFHGIDEIDKITKWREEGRRIGEVGFPEICQIDKI